MQKKTFFLTLVFLLLFSAYSFAQFNDYSVKGGIQGFGLLPDTDFEGKDLKAAYLGRGLLRIKLAYILDLELGAGYGILAGENPQNDYWETSIIPLDMRILLSPFDIAYINPYFYAGGGYLIWDVRNKPSKNLSPAPDYTKENGADFFIPVGGGFEVKLSNSLLLDISAGYTFSHTDNLNYWNNIDAKFPKSTAANDGYWAFGLGLIYSGESGSSDSDSDGLTKDQEIELGTNPEVADTDGDGIIDGLEINQYKTNPLVSDSDNDGCSDLVEIRDYKTNPNIKDTDEDNLSDGEEINKLKTNPLRNDTDFDGITDDNEVYKTKTDPTLADTDSDGLNDGEEIERYKSSPTNPDTDSDGLNDGDEVLKYNTNPNLADSDKGGISDRVEVTRGTNPLNPEDDAILDISTPLVLDGVTFATNSAELTPESEKMLMQVVNTLNAHPKILVEIRGYTDNVGNAASNLQLSQRRANSVRFWVISKGIAANRVNARGYGEQDPIASNNTKEGRRLNRRIEFVKIN